MFYLIQKILSKSKISLFSAIPLYMVHTAIFGSIIFTLLLAFVDGILYFDYVWRAFFVICFALFAFILELWYLIKFRELRYWKRDERKNDYCRDTVVLTHSEAVEKRSFWGITNFILFFTNFGKGAKLHRFYYRSSDSDSSEQKYFYYIVDEDTLQYFQKVTDLSYEHWTLGFG